MGNKGRKFPAEPLAREEVLGLLAACSRKRPLGIRNRALIVVLWRAQLRVSEALSLKPSDIDFNAGTMRVLYGKGGKARTVGIDVDALEFVQRWLDMREKLGVNGHKPLFCTVKDGPGRPLKDSYVRNLLPHLARKAGISKRVHAHGLRHTGAFELAMEGQPMNLIQQQLGHSSLATTDRYIRHLNPKEVVDVMRDRVWMDGPEGP